MRNTSCKNIQIYIGQNEYSSKNARIISLMIPLIEMKFQIKVRAESLLFSCISPKSQEARLKYIMFDVYKSNIVENIK